MIILAAGERFTEDEADAFFRDAAPFIEKDRILHRKFAAKMMG